MKKYTILLLLFMLWASAAAGQQATGAKEPETQTYVFEGFVGPAYNWVDSQGSTRAAEYDYLKSSFGGDVHVEYDPLPQRFSVETHYLNQKDYFGEMDYAYRDVVLFNFLARGVYHNLDHLTFGPDDLTTPSPSFTDLDPNAEYALENALRRGFIRFKTPDFPFHIYADATTIDRTGTIQQRFLRGFTGGLDKVSQSRDINWGSQDVRVGLNSHLGPVEVDYNHAEKKFTARGSDKVLYDVYPLFTAPHNEVPNLTSSTDTIKLHSSYTGRVVAAAAYSSGERKNKDSGAKAEFRDAAGDLTLTPVAGLALVVKYRHYDLSVNNPDTVAVPGIGGIVAVRDSISSKRDIVSGVARYRVTDRLTAKGEYAVDSIDRNIGTGPDAWDVAHRTTKATSKLGLYYRMMSKLALRADYSAAQVENPAYPDDPDRINAGTLGVTWTPVQRLIAFASFGEVQEKRNMLTAPLAGGGRKTTRDQALGSVTFLVGNRSSITASYFYYKNKTNQTLTFQDDAGNFLLDWSAPYNDTAEVFSLAASQALAEGVMVTADASRSYSKGNFRVDGSVPGTTGIDTLSDLKVVEDIITAGLEVQFNKNTGGEFRYQYRKYDDKINNTQDGRVNTAMTTLYVKW
jgi:hypothetical protein